MNDETTLQLTDDEERRFAELFDEPTRLDLGDRWEPVLRAAIARDGAPENQDRVDVLDLTAARERRSARSPRWFAAAAAALAVVVGVAAVGLRGVGGPSTEQVEVLAPSRQIAAPAVADLDLPADTVGVTVLGEEIVAVAETASSTMLRVRTDGAWVERSELDLVDAQLLVDGDQWVIAGVDATTRVERPGVEGTFLATSLVVATSLDAGVTWTSMPIVPEQIAVRDQIVLDAFPEGSRTIIRDLTLATHDGTVAVLYDTAVHVDLTATARAAGLVEADDTVVFVAEGGFDVSTVVVGPGRPGPIDVAPAVVGTTRTGLDALFAEVTASRFHLVVGDGGDLTEVELPGVLGNEPFTFDEWRASMLGADDDGFVVSDLNGNQAFRSADGRNWTATELEPPVLDLGNGWAVSFDDDGEVRQSIDGGPFRRIPVPTDSTTVAALAPTSFGGAVVWQDVPSIVRGLLDARVVSNGWLIERTITGGLVFTGPDGESFSPPNGTGQFDGGFVVTDLDGTVQVFDDTGDRVVFAERDDFRVDVEGLRPSEQFVGWSTDGADWRYAEIDALEPGLWGYTETPEGLLGFEVLRADRAVLIEWPDEYAGN